MNEKIFSTIWTRYEKQYEFRFCKEREWMRLIQFIDCFWSKNHVLSQSKELLDWQYLDRENHRYNFVLAIHRDTDEIHGILGFIPTNLFDSEIEHPMRWGAVWKIRDDAASKGLGLALKFYLYQNAPAPYSGGIGLSRFSREINKKMGEEVGIMEHFYMIHPRMEHFVLAKQITSSDRTSCGVSDDTIHFQECLKAEFIHHSEDYLNHLLPYKSKMYYVKRFFEHPFYKYLCIKTVDNQQKSHAAFFLRICEHRGAKCIMIVDFLGDESALIGTESCFQKLLSDYQGEYISFYEYGLNSQALLQAGFKNRKESDIILPLYYEPFEPKNVDIDFHYYNDESAEKKLYFFKGDADQDRPNIL